MTSGISGDAHPETILLLASTRRDGELTRDLLESAGMRALVCASVGELTQHIEAGAAAALITEERLDDGAMRRIAQALSHQQPWSDFPILVFRVTGRTATPNEALRQLGNVTFLDRPVHVRTMLAAATAAVRARKKQYDARRAIESRDQFLAMLGHELRNPLGAIRLAVELTARGDSESLRERQRAIIDRQSRHLARLVDDLLDVARVTYGKVAIQAERFDLGEAVQGCCAAHVTAARATGLTFTFAVPGEPVVVDADRLRIDQVVTNLVTNAIKYTPRGGTMHVELRTQGERAILSVSDSGIGIAPEMLPRVFDLFTQADRTLDRAQGGMGLGLTVVRSLVHLHGGDVEARSAGLGHGSEFLVTLPLARGPSDSERAAARSEPPEAGRKIVLVEDNDDIRTALEDLLRLTGHQVATAIDGPEGVATILREHPDVAFVDLGLPGFDGFELARRVRASQANRVRLVAVSGYGQPEDRRRSREAGFDAHLTKPVGLEQLEAVMSYNIARGS